jgi:DNA (cytosine-5)-methyltransferase 1
VTATAHKGWSRGHNRADTDDRIDYTVEREAGDGSRLNPDWCEWLMGWPIGWTRLEPLKIDVHDYNWSVDPADTGVIPRTTIERTHRSHRIRCIGNGQVPQAVEFAWRLLNDKTE